MGQSLKRHRKRLAASPTPSPKVEGLSCILYSGYIPRRIILRSVPGIHRAANAMRRAVFPT